MCPKKMQLCAKNYFKERQKQILAIFTISDLHLSLNKKTNKSMEVFGRRWQAYTEKLEKNWRAVITENDTVIVPGDISWALTPEEAVADFNFINSLPGKKLIGKGNHDFWWQTVKKLTAFTEKNGFNTIKFLYNNAYEVENTIICGTRGWFYDPSCDNMPEGTDFAKIMAREAIRLKMSLDAALALKKQSPEKEILVFLHFPIIWGDKCSEELFALIKEYGIHRVYFGHIHGSYDMPSDFEADGVHFTLISADFLSFIPKIVQK